MRGAGNHAEGPRTFSTPRGSWARTPERKPATPNGAGDRKSTRLNSSHLVISYAVFCLKKKNEAATTTGDARKSPRRPSPSRSGSTRAAWHKRNQPTALLPQPAAGGSDCAGPITTPQGY